LLTTCGIQSTSLTFIAITKVTNNWPTLHYKMCALSVCSWS